MADRRRFLLQAGGALTGIALLPGAAAARPPGSGPPGNGRPPRRRSASLGSFSTGPTSTRSWSRPRPIVSVETAARATALGILANRAIVTGTAVAIPGNPLAS